MDGLLGFGLQGALVQKRRRDRVGRFLQTNPRHLRERERESPGAKGFRVDCFPGLLKLIGVFFGALLFAFGAFRAVLCHVSGTRRLLDET